MRVSITSKMHRRPYLYLKRTNHRRSFFRTLLLASLASLSFVDGLTAPGDPGVNHAVAYSSSSSNYVMIFSIIFLCQLCLFSLDQFGAYYILLPKNAMRNILLDGFDGKFKHDVSVLHIFEP